MNLHDVTPAQWDWPIFGTVLGAIFLAQLLGKSAATALVLSSRNRTVPVLLGVALALAAHGVLAVTAGGVLSLRRGLPLHRSGILVWRRRPREAELVERSLSRGTESFLRKFALAFMAVFVAEWGDLTQLATATLVARYGEPLVILGAAVLGLWGATGIAVLIGRALGHFVRPTWVQRIAAAAFAALGIALVIGLA